MIVYVIMNVQGIIVIREYKTNTELKVSLIKMILGSFNL